MYNNTKPEDAIELIQVYWYGLLTGLVSKEEILDWAEKVVDNVDYPHIFYIDLFMLSQKTTLDIASFLDKYLELEKPSLCGRAILCLMYEKFLRKEISIEFIVKKMYAIKDDANFTENEINFIYRIDNDFDILKEYNFDLTIDNIQYTLQDTEIDLGKFLAAYKEFTLENFTNWKYLDQVIETSNLNI